MSFPQLKTVSVFIIFLLLLVLDAPEFAVCTYNLPDEILDIPRVLTNGSQTNQDFLTKKVKSLKGISAVSYPPNKKLTYAAAEKKKGTAVYFQSGVVHGHLAGIKRYCLYWGGNQQGGSREWGHHIREIGTEAIFFEKSDHISSTLTPELPQVLRI